MLETIFPYFTLRKAISPISANNSESAIACMVMLASWHGRASDLIEIRHRFSGFVGALSPSQVLELAREFNFSGRIVRAEPEELTSLSLPCLLFWNLKRYVVLEKFSDQKIVIVDPPYGRRVISHKEFSSRFTGVAIEIFPDADFHKVEKKPSLRTSKLWTWSRETKSALAQSIFLSLFLQLCVLLAPLFFQIVIDSTIPSNDQTSLAILAVAFGVLVLISAAAGGIRSLTFQFFAHTAAFDIGAKLHNRLFRLPIAFFERRQLGEVFNAFRAVDVLRQYVNNVSLVTIADGLLAIMTCVLMFVYSPFLASLAIGAGLIYVLARTYFNTLCKSLFAEIYETEFRENSYFYETLRGIQNIKVANMVARRDADWQNLYIGKTNATFRWQATSIGFQTVASFLSGVTDVVIIYIAATKVMNGTMTIGVVTAFLAYKTLFFTRFVLCVDQLAQYRVLEVHLGRMADIVFSETETATARSMQPQQAFKGQVKFRDVTFSYVPNGPLVANKLSLDIEAGEFVAVVGPSGTGKSTFLKLLLGLYEPLSGEIFVDDYPISQAGSHLIREHLGSVMQEDIVFSGTIADNISLFDENADFDWIRTCAQLAQFDDVVTAMPHQYNTLLGDLGSVISSGQKQRLLIARALYKKPQIMVMDEGTANLDTVTERKIIEMLRSLKITKILVAHSPAIAAAADTVYEIEAGMLKKRPNSRDVRTAEILPV